MRQKKAKQLKRLAKRLAIEQNVANEGRHYINQTRPVVFIVRDEAMRADGTFVERRIELPPVEVFRWAQGWKVAYKALKRGHMPTQQWQWQ